MNLCVGRMQMHPIDFWHVYSFAEIQVKLHYFMESESSSTKERWELARIQSYLTLSPNLKEGAKVTDILELPWDKENAKAEKQTITQEDIERSMRLLDLIPK